MIAPPSIYSKLTTALARRCMREIFFRKQMLSQNKFLKLTIFAPFASYKGSQGQLALCTPMSLESAA